MKRILMGLTVVVLIISLAAGLGVPPAQAERKEVRYQTELDYPPYKFRQNEFAMGFDLELTQLIFEADRYELIYAASDWADAYQGVVGGKVDTAGLMAVQEDRKREILFSKPVMRTYIGVYAGRAFRGNVTQNTLKNYTVGVGAGQYSETLLREEAGLSDYTAYPTVEAGLLALEQGDIDLLFENQNVVDYLIVKRELTGKVHKVMEDMYPRDVAYGVSKNSPELVRYINGRIDDLRCTGTYEEIYRKYFYTHSEYYWNSLHNRLILIGCLVAGLIALSYLLLRIYINRLRRTIRGEREFSREVLDHTDLFIWAVQSDGTTVRLNRYAEWITGVKETDAVGRNYLELPALQQVCREVVPLVDQAIAYKFVENRELSLPCANQGRTKAFLFRTAVIPGLRGDPDVFVISGVDIQERKQYENKLQYSYQELEATYQELTATQEELERQYNVLEANQAKLRLSEERFRLAALGSGAAIWETDSSMQQYYVSDRLFELLGFTRDEIETTTAGWKSLIHPEDQSRTEKLRSAYLDGKAPIYESEYRMRKKEGDYLWIQARGMLRKDAGGKPVRFAGSMIDITDRKRYELQLQHLAYYDALSDLPNRYYLLEELEKRFSRPDGSGALFFVDTDNFKFINDTLGHKFGDRLLIEASSRLSSLIGEEGMLFRLGGDEFVVLLKEPGEERAAALADKLLQGFKEPFEINGSDVHMSVSIGISFYPQDGGSPEEILKNADVAMYAAKEAGKGKYVIFQPAFLQAFNERVHLEKYLRQALERREFAIHYQPQVHLRSGSICGFEALIRWNSPELGNVSPLSFIKVAEDSRLIVPIGEWALAESCAFAQRLQEEGAGAFKMAVNISVVQLLEEDFADTVLRILERTGLAPELLELEITESMFMESLALDRLVPKLELLKSRGIQIALDDFGTGYSSLGSLKQMPITTLKVDKSFIDHVPDRRHNRSLARAIVLIGRKMGLQVVAEGVETAEQMEHVRRIKCDIVQGYYISKPLPEAGIRDLLRSGRDDAVEE
ncbi:EAL domain-containing protein [Paenibacillus macerans]|uniref:EAL domain-containing protein n=1 Tax=Paenibacillus macerans TaxID=44252 RepID=UPI003D30F546